MEVSAVPATAASADIAEVAGPEVGPRPAVRALVGLLLGLAAGVLGALLTSRGNRSPATQRRVPHNATEG